jgi:acetoacetyl-CoA reductase
MVAAVPKDALEWVIANIPVGRLGRPQEIAHAFRFLSTDDAAYVTGSVISVNGGMEM